MPFRASICTEDPPGKWLSSDELDRWDFLESFGYGCDWGFCDDVIVGVRLCRRSEQILGVCSEHLDGDHGRAAP